MTEKLKRGETMSEILLGIDIGTSSCKAAAFAPNGTVVGQVSRTYPVRYPKPGWAEQNPDEWWKAVCGAIRTLLHKSVNASDIRGIGVDGQSWSAVAVDTRGRVLCDTPIWMDIRAQEICGELKNRFGEDRLFRMSGNPVQPMYTMPKVLWYQKYRPELYRDIFKILQSNSFIAYRLTGTITQEPSQGYGWNCYDIANGAWNTELCGEMGIDPALLPELVSSHTVIGAVTPAAAEETGLHPGIPVVAGGLDAACGTLGVGVIHQGETQEQGGQAGGMSICMDVCRRDPRLILGTHVVPGRWLLQGGTVGGGGALNWFEKEFCEMERVQATKKGTNSFVEMDEKAGEIPAGSEGLVFLPYLAGERSPIWDAKARGVFYGIDFSKTRAHFARAVMEGVAYSLRHNLEVAEQTGAHAATLRAMGGAANSPLWMQIKADVTGHELIVPSADTATALGAAILAGVGTGVYKDYEDAVRRTVTIRRAFVPNPGNGAVYSEGYENYRNLYGSLKSLMHGVKNQ